jgi:hypothetical protein
MRKKVKKPTQGEIQQRTFEKAPLLGRRGNTPIPSYGLQRMIELGLRQPEKTDREALIESAAILSQLIKPAVYRYA